MMVFIAATLLGVCFSAAGLVAKHIESPGMMLANRTIHSLIAWIGALSNLILPFACTVLTFAVGGVMAGLMMLTGLVAGAVGLGLLRLPYVFHLMLTVFGLPLAVVLFALSFMTL